IVVFGEPSVGKTCFIDQFCYGRSFVIYDPDNSVLSHKIVVDGEASDLTLMDLSTSFLKPEHAMQYTEWAEKMLAEADGIVLLYDVTSLASFEYVIDQAYKFLWGCRRLKSESDEEDGGGERGSFGCVLVGNKLDLVDAGKESKAVGRTLAEEWAQSQGIRSIEMVSLEREGPESALKLLVENIKKVERLEGR
ncbi:P-loop containing nucleoside triphosphate hydrolase protein, partial [Macroventuria anomochaeta]